jgi:hypothetical protein
MAETWEMIDFLTEVGPEIHPETTTHTESDAGNTYDAELDQPGAVVTVLGYFFGRV